MKKLFIILTKANIPVRHKPDCINQVQKLFKRWADLRKIHPEILLLKKQRKMNFWINLKISLILLIRMVLIMIVNEDDQDFLIAQREKGQRGTLSSLDRELATKKEQKREQNKQKNASWLQMKMDLDVKKW